MKLKQILNQLKEANVSGMSKEFDTNLSKILYATQKHIVKISNCLAFDKEIVRGGDNNFFAELHFNNGNLGRDYEYPIKVTLDIQLINNNLEAELKIILPDDTIVKNSKEAFVNTDSLLKIATNKKFDAVLNSLKKLMDSVMLADKYKRDINNYKKVLAVS